MHSPFIDSDVLVTIRDLVEDSDLAMSAAFAPVSSMNTPVSWVHATEQVDPRPHLRRHELVCTLGSSLVEAREALRFVEAVADAEVSGVALGLGEVHLEPPAALVRACQQMNMPLLLLPHGVPFLAVNDAVLRKRNEREGEARRKETTLLSALLTLARDGVAEEQLIEAANAQFGGRFSKRAMTTGDVFVWKGTGKEPSVEFLDQFASLVEFAKREQARVALERQEKLGQLIELIMTGLAHPAALYAELEEEGLNPDELRVSSWPHGSESAIAERWPKALVAVAARSTFMIGAAESPEELRRIGLVCGYSSVLKLPELRRGLSESLSALRLARSRGGVAGPEQLVSLDALLEQLSAEQLAPFVEQLLTPVVRADASGRGELVETLREFLASEGGLQATASKLYVHVNTVRHRLKRIEQLTGRDPYTLAGKVDLTIALWAAERQKIVGRRLIRPLQ